MASTSNSEVPKKKHASSSSAGFSWKEANKKLFLRELKARYKQLYDAVQPIPFGRDTLYSVDSLFVEGAIEYLAETWLPLGSYHHVFVEPRVKSNRRFLIGEPGYGKSTLTLQFAYDWCNGVQESYLKDVEILILLRLRQLGGVTSIYHAIKRFILSSHSQLTEHDIESVLEHSTSVLLILDGLDQYPDVNNNPKTDIMKIILSQMFKEFEVIITTTFVPSQCAPEAKQLRLVGFDEKSRDEYFRKTAVSDDVNRIKQRLQENPFLSDLCQVPFLFTMFVHMNHEDKDYQTLSTVTDFFQYVIKCCHSHIRNKMDDANSHKYRMLEEHHIELDKVAFESLNRENQQIVWNRQELVERLGKDFYDQYVRIGILVEDACVDDVDLLSNPEVRFYHKLFCEWYAAHYLAKCAQGISHPNQLREVLRYMDPNGLQYCYRFACGLNHDASGNIIQFVKMRSGSGNLKPATLCVMERKGTVEDNLDIVKDLLIIKLEDGDSKLLQRCTLKLLEIASSKNITIPYMDLKNCFSTVDLSGGNYLQLKSDLSIPVLTTLNKLMIHEEGREITAEEFAAILQYSSQCLGLCYLWVSECLLPLSAPFESASVLRSRNVAVVWMPQQGFQRYTLNLQSCLWEHTYLSLSRKRAIKVMTVDDHQRVVRKFREKWERKQVT